MAAWYCMQCGALAESIQPSAAQGVNYGTGVCSGAHRYASPTPEERRAARRAGVPVTTQALRRVGAIYMADPPPAREARPRSGYPPPAARSLWGDE